MATEETTTQPTRTEVEAEIEQLRESLGETVEALTHKFDVKTRAKRRVQSVPPVAAGGVAVAILAGLGLWIWRRRS